MRWEKLVMLFGICLGIGMEQKEEEGLKVGKENEEKREILNIEGVVGKVLNNFFIEIVWKI